MLSASTKYNKQDGTLALSQDNRTVLWTPARASSPTLSITAKEVSNVQQTPATSAKVILRFVVQRDAASAAETHSFQFTSGANARAEQVAILEGIKKEIEAIKKQTATPQSTGTPAKTSTPAPPSKDGEGGQSAAMAIAQAVAAAAKAEEDKRYDASRLLLDTQLQRSLLESNPLLMQKHNQALREKPESITFSQFETQFWSSRVHLLREHAVEVNQNQGQYNVLSGLKFNRDKESGKLDLSLTAEQIQLIFSQHPLIRTIYDREVFGEKRDEKGILAKGLSPGEFWYGFINSRLYRKLRGDTVPEKGDMVEATALERRLNSIFEKYLNFDEEAERARQLEMLNVPHFIDLEGNEQNHSQRKGNAPDYTMRPRSQFRGEVPILRVLNRLSEKIMADVPPADLDLHAPAGMDEDTFQQLQLRDLQRDSEDNRVMLKVNDPKRIFSRQKGDPLSDEAALYAKKAPTEVMSAVGSDFDTIWRTSNSQGGLNLEAVIGFNDDSDSEDEGEPKQAPRVGSQATRAASTKQILGAVRQRRAQTEDVSGPPDPSATFVTGINKYGFKDADFESLAMTHSTTVEFLHYFWMVFLSGDPDRAGEVVKLAEALERSHDRIQAAADSADKERNLRIEECKQKLQQLLERSGRKKKFDPAAVRGGAKAVKSMVNPTVRALKAATDEYRKILEVQLQQQQSQPG